MSVEILIMGPMKAIEARLEPHFTLRRFWLDEDRTALRRDVCPRVRGLVTYTGARAAVDAAFLASLPSVEIIANMGAGYETVDIETAKARGIIVTNAGGVNAVDVAEHAFGLVLSVAREIASADRYVRAGRWRAEGRMQVGRRLSGRKLGILGLGHIGKAIARCASGFDMPVFYHNRHRVSDAPYSYVDTVEGLARAVDVLAIAAPGGVETHHLVNARVLDALGPSGILVNVGRGSIVDQDALIDALAAGRIAGAGLDVFENEPDVPERLLSLPNVVLQPHMAGSTREGIGGAIDALVDNLLSHFAGGAVKYRVA